MNVKKVIEEVKKLTSDDKQAEFSSVERLITAEQEVDQKHLDELNQRILELSKPKVEDKQYKDFMDELLNGEY